MKVDKSKRFQFIERSDRAKYIGLVYKDFLKGKVADIGSSGSDLRHYVEDEYIGIDILDAPEIDITVDLEKEKIPLETGTVDCVVCTDVLEHVDNFHEVFKELIRISKKYIIISLPNCFNYEIIFKIWFGKNIKFYGLPDNKPDDRHKWFLNHSETINFFKNHTSTYGYSVIDSHGHPLKYRGFKGNIILALVWILSFGRYKQLSTMSSWVLLEIHK